MNKLQKKLRSRVGATMVLAMVFMLFCSFIGGSVLASATANAQRVAQMAEQQDFLLERSAALLVSDQLQLDGGKYLQLIIVDQDRTIQAVVVGQDGSVTPIPGKTAEDRVITFQVHTTATLTDMHQLMLESAVWRYLRENAYGENPIIEFKNFPDGITKTDQFLFKYPLSGVAADDYLIEGSLTVTSSNFSHGSTVTSIPTYTANFSIGRGLHAYDFFVDFGVDSQLKMTMNAFSGKTEPVPVVHPPCEDNTGYFENNADIQITAVTTQTTISWQNPLIEKGGAAR